MISFSSFTQDDAEALRNFHERSFGPASYQALAGYTDWLYGQNPMQVSAPAAILAKSEGGAIVGCIHAMALSSKQDDRPIRIQSLQNLILDNEYRTGHGMLLVKRSLKNADVTIFPGVAEPLAKAYRVMKYPELDTFWGRKVLRPVSAALSLARGKIGQIRPALAISADRIKEATVAGLRVCSRPNMAVLSDLCSALAERDEREKRTTVNWTPEALNWRFFSPDGPSHILVLSEKREDFCIVSIGIRHNVSVARLVEYNAASKAGFLASVLVLVRNLGVETSLAFGSGPNDIRILHDLGFSGKAQGNTSFVVSKVKLSPAFGLTAGATDIGFESFRTDIEPVEAGT